MFGRKVKPGSVDGRADEEDDEREHASETDTESGGCAAAVDVDCGGIERTRFLVANCESCGAGGAEMSSEDGAEVRRRYM